MSKVSHLPKIVPPKEIPFSIKVKGAATGFEYTGDFTVKVPTGREISKIGVELARLNVGLVNEDLDDSTATFHNAVAFLKSCLVEAPKWFTNSPENEEEAGIFYGLDSIDVNVAIEIFIAANSKVNEWHKSLAGQPKK